MHPTEIVLFWKQSNLLRWPEALLKNVAIPNSAKLFLVEVGLPSGVDWTLRFDNATFDLLEKHSGFRQFGYDDATPICFRETDGAIVAVEIFPMDKVIYLNASVEAFGAFLVLYQRYRTGARQFSEEDILRTIDATENEMHTEDPTALVSPNNYWSLILEQMRQGLL